MNTYPTRCPCGRSLEDYEQERDHIANWCEYDPVDAIKQATRRLAMEQHPMREAIRDLVEWKPSYEIPLENPPCTECGNPKDEHVGMGSDYHEFEPGPSSRFPFMSESFLYDLLGKEDARALLGRMRRVMALAGYEEDA